MEERITLPKNNRDYKSLVVLLKLNGLPVILMHRIDWKWDLWLWKIIQHLSILQHKGFCSYFNEIKRVKSSLFLVVIFGAFMGILFWKLSIVQILCRKKVRAWISIFSTLIHFLIIKKIWNQHIFIFPPETGYIW